MARKKPILAQVPITEGLMVSLSTIRNYPIKDAHSPGVVHLWRYQFFTACGGTNRISRAAATKLELGVCEKCWAEMMKRRRL